MSALPPWMTPDAPHGDAGHHSSLPGKWARLENAAGVVAALAGVRPEPEASCAGFPAGMSPAPAWRRDLAERGIDAVVAAIEPGLSALLSIEARGGDPRPVAARVSSVSLRA